MLHLGKEEEEEEVMETKAITEEEEGTTATNLLKAAKSLIRLIAFPSHLRTCSIRAVSPLHQLACHPKSSMLLI